MKSRNSKLLVATSFSIITVAYTLLTGFRSNIVFQQRDKQNFIVKNYQNIPLKGCSLLSKDSLTARTDSAGKCSISLLVPNQVVFRLRGYQTKSISITRKYEKEIVVRLAPIKSK